MKKLKLKLQDLTNPSILSHHEIKNIMGGSGDSGGGSTGTGTCAVHCPMGDGGTFYHKSYAEAYDMYLQCVSLGILNAHWCCDGCLSASWYHPS